MAARVPRNATNKRSAVKRMVPLPLDAPQAVVFVPVNSGPPNYTNLRRGRTLSDDRQGMVLAHGAVQGTFKLKNTLSK